MSFKHHIRDDTLAAYSNGTLPKSLSVLVATHLAMCEECQRTLELMDQMSEVSFIRDDRVSMSSADQDLCDLILESDRNSDGALALMERPVVRKDVPAPLADMLPSSLDEIRWKRLVPGVSHYPLSSSENEKTEGVLRLLKIAPGTAIPEHTHTRQELTLILRGSYIDDIGRFAAGDVADLDDEIDHQPVADTDQDCICLIATDGPLKFSGFFSRLLQPLVGI